MSGKGCVEEMCSFQYVWVIYFYFHKLMCCCISEPLVLSQNYFLVVDLKLQYSLFVCTVWIRSANVMGTVSLTY